MTTPSPTIAMTDVETALNEGISTNYTGGKAPISFNDYLVRRLVSQSTTITDRGQISMNQMRSKAGPTPVNTLISGYCSGGTYYGTYADGKYGTYASNTLNSPSCTRYRILSAGDTSTALMMGANTTSGGNASYTMAVSSPYTSFGLLNTSANPIATGLGPSFGNNLTSYWFPLLPNLYQYYYNSSSSYGYVQHPYCLGTGTVQPAYNTSNVPVFVWRSRNSNWSDAFVQGMLGFSAYNLSQVKNAERVAWINAYSGMDTTLYYGLALLSASQYNSTRSAQYVWDNKQIFQIYYNNDFDTEWQDHGFNFNVTASISADQSSYSISNQTSFTMTGATYRDSGGRIGSYSDYTVLLNPDWLVVPVVYSNTGFSGGGGGARSPLKCTFTWIEAY
mgnify:CR=1 FL=1